jgi:hypothetical protein
MLIGRATKARWTSTTLIGAGSRLMWSCATLIGGRRRDLWSNRALSGGGGGETVGYSSLLSLPPVTWTRLPVMKEPSGEASST